MAISPNTQALPATPQPGFIDPTTLPDEYAMRVRGDCLAPAIKGGDSVLVDQRQPYAVGDLVCVFLKPECVAPGCTNVGLKRLVMNMMPGVTYPYQAHPDSNIMPVLVCEQDNPHRQYTIPADQILAIHRCMGLVPDDVVLHDPGTGERRYRTAVASAGWSRRDLLAGAITIVPAVGAAIAATPGDDAELRRLWVEYLAQTERYEVAREACAPARAAFDAEYPPCPRDVLPGKHWNNQKPLWRKHGLDELWGEQDRQSDKLWALVEAILETPAEGLFGIGVKLAAQLPDHGEYDVVAAAAVVLADINRMTGADFDADAGDLS